MHRSGNAIWTAKHLLIFQSGGWNSGFFILAEGKPVCVPWILSRFYGYGIRSMSPSVAKIATYAARWYTFSGKFGKSFLPSQPPKLRVIWGQQNSCILQACKKQDSFVFFCIAMLVFLNNWSAGFFIYT